MPQCPAGTYFYTIQAGDSLWLIAQRFHTTVQEIMLANPGLDANNLLVGYTICIPNIFRPGSVQPLFRDIDGAVQILSNQMRLLWEQHVYWTRMAILSMAFGLPDEAAVTDRLLRNPKDFESVLKQYYGEDIATEFAELLTSHLAIAAELVNAAKAGNNAAAVDAEKRWYANADQIAVFLGGINPHWSMQKWQKMLYDHLAMTESEAVDILSQKHEDSINIFEDIEQEALAMADMMTQGITKQFFQYFR